MEVFIVQNGKVVSISYVLKNAKGEELDRAEESSPLSFIQGGGEILPALQSALDGAKVGDTKSVTLSAQEGYGERNDSLKMTLQKSAFPPDVQLQTGMYFQAEMVPGKPPVTFTVIGVEKDQVFVDGNHPLAGETLHFTVKVTSVRDATAEEKTHGHVHGPGGHHH